jgi:hypothetical protein
MCPLNFSTKPFWVVAGSDVMPIGCCRCAPDDDGIQDELGAAVADNHRRSPAPGDKRVELADNRLTLNRRGRDQGETFARHIIDDVEVATSWELALDKIKAPVLIVDMAS